MRTTFNLLTNELFGIVKACGGHVAASPVSPEQLVALAALVYDDILSTRMAKQVLCAMAAGDDRQPAKIAKDAGLIQILDESVIKAAIAKALESNHEVLARYHAGEKKLAGFFVGQVMKATHGKANPQLTLKLVRSALEAGLQT